MSKRADELSKRHWRKRTNKTVYSTNSPPGYVSRAELKEQIERDFSDYRIQMRQERVEAEEARKKEELKQKNLRKLGHMAAGLPAYAASAAIVKGVRIPGTTRTAGDLANSAGRTVYNFAKTGESGADIIGASLAKKQTTKIIKDNPIPGVNTNVQQNYVESTKSGGILQQADGAIQRNLGKRAQDIPGFQNPSTEVRGGIMTFLRGYVHGKKEAEAMNTPQHNTNYNIIIEGIAGAEADIRKKDLEINALASKSQKDGLSTTETKKMQELMKSRVNAQTYVNQARALPATEVAEGTQAYQQKLGEGRQYEQRDYSALAGAGAELGLILYAGAKLAKITRPLVKATYKIGRGIAHTVGAAAKGLEKVVSHSKGKSGSIEKTADMVVFASFIIFALLSSFRITGFVINNNPPQPAQLFSLIILGLVLLFFLISKIYKHIKFKNNREKRK